MNFQGIPAVDNAQELTDRALGKARKRAEALKGKFKNKETRSKQIVFEKIIVVRKSFVRDIEKIIDKFPDLENLPEFYEELCKNQFDIDTARENLGRISGVMKSVTKLSNDFGKQCGEDDDPIKTFKMYVGRISSLVGKIDGALKYLERARQVLLTFPAIKEDHFTVALAGFPNVGKSTLLAKLTTAKPKIANYAFTTKTLNIGYYKESYHDVQVIDTPGTLARFEKMNDIERMAYLALKYEADVIVMVFDPTESYSQQDQEKLLAEITEHEKQIIFYLSKTDMVSKEQAEKFSTKYDCITDANELKTHLAKEILKR